jgi:hypothetical protein
MNPKQDSFLFPCGSCLYLGTIIPMPVSKEPFRLREKGALWRVLCFLLAHNSVSGRFDPVKEKRISLHCGREDESIMKKPFDERLQSLLSQYAGSFSQR